MFIQFTNEYANQLKPAAKIYTLGELLTKSELPDSSVAYKYTSSEFNLTENIEDEDIPDLPGVVVGVCQVTKDRSGFIRVRWGEPLETNTIIAEYHFGAAT